MLDATLKNKNNSKACVNLFQDFISQLPSGDNSEVKPDMSVEDHHYGKEEYGQLSAAKKLGLKTKRTT